MRRARCLRWRRGTDRRIIDLCARDPLRGRGGGASGAGPKVGQAGRQGQGDLAELRARLVRYARLLTRDAATAEDLVQDTLVAVYQRRSAPRGEASITTWAIGILKHKSADWWRSPESRWATNLDVEDRDDPLDAMCRDCEHLGSCVSPAVEPDVVLERHELAAAIARCASRLSVVGAQVFILHECLGLDTAEVCVQLGLSPANCRMLLHRARASLRRCLEHDWQPERGRGAERPSRQATAQRPTR